MSKEKHYLYCLIKDNKPTYVGVTKDIHRRRQQHKSKGKVFDNLLVVKSYNSKKEALIAENSIIRMNGLFNLGLENAKYCLDEYYYSVEVSNKYR
jgi:predicted GIY-YIG superfamily endonuclease